MANQLIVLGSADPWGSNGFSGPDPVSQGDTGWTWDVELTPNPTQFTYARTSLNSFSNIGGDTGWVLSGIVSYRTRDANGRDTFHAVGQGQPDGLADFMNDVGVDDVTFGWTVEGDDYTSGRINFEIWVTV